MTDLSYSRTLAAVLTADIIGYSRLMEQDEASTMAAWWSYRQEIIVPAVGANLGRIVNIRLFSAISLRNFGVMA